MKHRFLISVLAAATAIGVPTIAFAQDGGAAAQPAIIFAPKTETPPAPSGPSVMPDGTPVIFGPINRAPVIAVPPPVPDVIRKPAPPRTVISCNNLATYETSLASLHANGVSAKRVDKGLLDTALASYRKHVCGTSATGTGSIVVVDFARKSSEPRLWMIDLATGKGMDEPVLVTHGIGSDSNDDGVLDRFSNINMSLASSPGAVRGAEVYFGKNGRSLRLDGLDVTNSEIRRRDIVVHSVSARTRTYFRADYVANRGGNIGTSEGCFVVEPELRDWLIDSLAGGGFLYAGASGERGAQMIAALTAPPAPAKLPDGTQIIFAPLSGPGAVNPILLTPVDQPPGAAAAPTTPSATNAP